MSQNIPAEKLSNDDLLWEFEAECASEDRWISSDPPMRTAEYREELRVRLSELETLKAQLATAEAQVRELRKLLPYVQHKKKCRQQDCLAYPAFDRCNCRERHQCICGLAVIRSAPPSEWDKSSQALRDSTQHVHDEKTNTEEERKDLARQGSDGSVSDATRAQASIPATSVAAAYLVSRDSGASAAKAGGSSEQDLAAQVPAASDGFTDTRERAKMRLRKPPIRAWNILAPQDEYFKVRNWRDAQIAKLFEIKKVNLFCYKLYLGGVLLGADASEKRAHNRAQQILTTISKAIQETSPAPPSPAREKEK